VERSKTRLEARAPPLASEQARGDSVDARSELFSLGSTLFAVSGADTVVERTVTETIAAVLLKQPPPIHTLVTGLPEAFGRVIDKCLEKDLTKRDQTSAAILADLRSV
jgi:serine/threonine-protein kinase